VEDVPKPREIVGAMPYDDYTNLIERFSTNPEKYTKPIRIYCDVDGVVMPIIRTWEQYEAMDGKDTINFLRRPNFYHAASDIETGLFVYNKFVAEKLSEWSHRDDVDFIWLTAWRHNAVYSLDKILNVKSVGFLPWEERRSDYQHWYKRYAIEEEQKISPSKFVWLDDFANKRRYEDIPVFTDGHYSRVEVEVENPVWDDFTGSYVKKYEDGPFVIKKEIIPASQYLSLTTEGTLGLQPEDIAQVDAWLANQ